MDQFVTAYQAITTAGVSALRQLGVFTIPLAIAAAALVNLWGGERAIRAVAATVGVIVVLTLVLNNATSLGDWINAPHAVAGAAPVATAIPGR